ncbi:zinc-dependent peptidase [Myxococcota bacterium]|nr:zinc-dependent peptidase [Myxococcota bacterium]MBU1536714.1 zinc-dependent peptidase [Myxococcota bacterium]
MTVFDLLLFVIIVFVLGGIYLITNYFRRALVRTKNSLELSGAKQAIVQVKNPTNHNPVNPNSFVSASKSEILAVFPFFASVPEGLQDNMEIHVNDFLYEKVFIGKGDLEVTREMKISIAAQASLLMAGRKELCFPKLRTVEVYPAQIGPYEGLSIMKFAGETPVSGVVKVSWATAKKEGEVATPNRNVVLHEMAHQLDFEDGEADGIPELYLHILEVIKDDPKETWMKILNQSKSLFSQSTQEGGMHPHSLEDDAEFFAEASVAFFYGAHTLKSGLPKLYDLLARFYNQDPAAYLPGQVRG